MLEQSLQPEERVLPGCTPIHTCEASWSAARVATQKKEKGQRAPRGRKGSACVEGSVTKRLYLDVLCDIRKGDAAPRLKCVEGRVRHAPEAAWVRGSRSATREGPNSRESAGRLRTIDVACESVVSVRIEIEACGGAHLSSLSNFEGSLGSLATTPAVPLMKDSPLAEVADFDESLLLDVNFHAAIPPPAALL